MPYLTILSSNGRVIRQDALSDLLDPEYADDPGKKYGDKLRRELAAIRKKEEDELLEREKKRKEEEDLGRRKNGG